jgi:WD40 repeat protein
MRTEMHLILWLGLSFASGLQSPLPAQDSRVIATLKGHTKWVLSLTFHPDGKRIASGSSDGTVKVWDVASAKEILTIDGHLGSLNGVAYSPNGNWIAAAYAGGRAMKVWDATNGQPSFTVPGYAPSSVGYSPDGKRIATGNFDMTVRVYDATTGKTLLVIGEPSRPRPGVRAVFSPDGKRLARGFDNDVRIWDATTGRVVRTLAGHTEPVLGVTFSPDGKRIAGASMDHTVKVWDATNGKELVTFKGHKGPAGPVAFSPVGSRIASIAAGDESTAKVWDSLTGRENLVLNGQGGGLCLAFSPDGKWIATGRSDNTIVIWDATPKAD